MKRVSRLELHRKYLVLNASAVPPITLWHPGPLNYTPNFHVSKSVQSRGTVNTSVKKFIQPRNCICYLPVEQWLLLDTTRYTLMSKHFILSKSKSLKLGWIKKGAKLALIENTKPCNLDKILKQKIYLCFTVMDLDD